MGTEVGCESIPAGGHCNEENNLQPMYIRLIEAVKEFGYLGSVVDSHIYSEEIINIGDTIAARRL